MDVEIVRAYRCSSKDDFEKEKGRKKMSLMMNVSRGRETSPAGARQRHRVRVAPKARYAVWMVCLGIWCAGGVCRAQGRRLDERPTAGLLIPAYSLVADPQASAVEVNPANLGFLRSWSLSIRHTEMDWDGSRGTSGDALFWGQAIPWVPLAYGLGVQYLRWPDAFGPGYGDVAKLSGALAWQIVDWASVAVSFHHFAGPDSPGLSGLNTVELGALVRPWPELAAGLKVSDVFMPKWWGGLPVQRTWQLELGWRPTGTRRLTFSVGARFSERRLDVDPRFRAELVLWRGLVLRADAEYRHRALSWSDPMRDELIQNDLRATCALAVDFTHWGFEVGAAVGRKLADLPGHVFQGLSAAIRMGGAHTRSVWPDPHRAVVVKIPPAERGERQFWRVCRFLHRLQGEKRVQAVIVSVPDGGPGWARAQEVRAAMQALQAKGKKVVAYLKTAGAQAYYVATAADRIWLFPGGGLMMAGLGLTRLYFRKILARAGVEVQVVKHGAYKTAPESFTRTGPSSESRAVKNAVLDQTYAAWLQAMSTRKQIGSTEGAAALLEKGPFTPKEAVRCGLVDALVYEDEVPKQLRRLSGRSLVLARPERKTPKNTGWGLRPAVALVIIEGDIVPGRSQRVPLINRIVAGYATLSKVLKKLRADSRIEAVVLRIDSPGGTAEASEMLWREVMNLRKDKVVVASLSDTAASGGYQIAAAAERIFAEPATLTGSIGIFAAKPNVKQLMKKLGVGVHRWHRGAFASLKTVFSPYSKKELARLQKKLGAHYRGFVRNVAKGRKKLSFAQVEPLARGRVWTGRQAHKNGLVDRFGGVVEAVRWAQKRVGLPADAPVVVYPRQEPSLAKRILRALIARKQKKARMTLLSPLASALEALPAALLIAPQATYYARMEEIFTVR
jgi:protease-4